jgi:hypothetical protein
MKMKIHTNAIRVAERDVVDLGKWPTARTLAFLIGPRDNPVTRWRGYPLS